MESNWTESRTDRYVIEINFILPVSTMLWNGKKQKMSARLYKVNTF